MELESYADFFRKWAAHHALLGIHGTTSAHAICIAGLPQDYPHEHSDRDQFWGSAKAVAHVLSRKGFHVRSSLLANSNFDQQFRRDILIRHLKLFFQALPQKSVAKVAYVGHLDGELSHKQQVEELQSGIAAQRSAKSIRDLRWGAIPTADDNWLTAKDILDLWYASPNHHSGTLLLYIDGCRAGSWTSQLRKRQWRGKPGLPGQPLIPFLKASEQQIAKWQKRDQQHLRTTLRQLDQSVAIQASCSSWEISVGTPETSSVHRHFVTLNITFNENSGSVTAGLDVLLVGGYTQHWCELQYTETYPAAHRMHKRDFSPGVPRTQDYPSKTKQHPDFATTFGLQDERGRWTSPQEVTSRKAGVYSIPLPKRFASHCCSLWYRKMSPRN